MFSSANIVTVSKNFRVWKDFQTGRFTLCVSNEILEEYQEIIARKTNPIVAENVINAIVESEFAEFVDPQFHLELIVADHDDDSLSIAPLLQKQPTSFLTTAISMYSRTYPFHSC